MGELIGLTGEITAALPTLRAAAEAAGDPVHSCAELRRAVLAFLDDVEERRRRGWHKVNMKHVARLRELVEPPTSTREDPERDE